MDNILPYEITFNILSFLDYEDIYIYCYCNKYLSSIIKDFSFWKQYIEERNINTFPFGYNVDTFVRSLIRNKIRLLPIYLQGEKMDSMWINKFMYISEVIYNYSIKDNILYDTDIEILNWKKEVFVTTKYEYNDKYRWRGRSSRIMKSRIKKEESKIGMVGLSVYDLHNKQFDIFWDVTYGMYITLKTE